MTTVDESRASFLWSLVSPQQVMAAATTPQLRRDAAAFLGVSIRTVQRHAGRRLACPGPRCLTVVRGGGLCSFCRKTEILGKETG